MRIDKKKIIQSAKINPLIASPLIDLFNNEIEKFP